MNMRMMFARVVAGAAMLGLAGCASRPNIEEFAFVPCDGATTAEIARLAKVSGGTDDRVWNINKDRDRAAENAAVWYESTPIRFGTNMVCVAVAKLGRKGSPIQIADAVFRSQILCRHDAGHSIILQCAAAFGRGENERLLVVKPNATYRNESVIHIFDQSFTCVWEMEHVPGRRWRAVVSPRFPDSVFLCQKDLDTGEYECYKITKAADKITDGEESK